MHHHLDLAMALAIDRNRLLLELASRPARRPTRRRRHRRTCCDPTT